MLRLHHVNVVVPPGKTDEVAGFYSEQLGLARVEKPEGTDRTGAWFDIPDGTQLHISEREGALNPYQHFALVVDDFDGLVARLPEWRSKNSVLGAHRGETRDPAGNCIELIERAGDFA